MEELKDARVLVTGSDGFIGSHVVEELVRAGAKVKAVVLYNSFNSWGWLDTVPADIMKSVEVVAGDIRDPHFMISAAAGCTDVMHLAALIAIPFSYAAPNSYVETNVRGTVNVLQAARHAGVRRFVQTSTSEVYGSAQIVPIKESHPLVGQSPYSASKIASDQMALSFHASFDMPVVVVRPFNTYGPRQSARAVIPDHHQPDCVRQAQDPPRRGQPDPRLLVRDRHRARPDLGPDGAGGTELSGKRSTWAAALRYRSARQRA